jgi:Protein of unknown function (DUF2934)
MTAHASRKAPTSVQHENPVPSVEDEIRRRAYELYEQRGREDGRDQEDWLRAEEEIKQARNRRFAA